MMTAPAITFYDSTNSTAFNDSTPLDMGTVNPGVDGDVVQLNIWNNKAATVAVANMENVRITTVTKNGYTSGDTVAYGKDVVEETYIQAREHDSGSYTPIGGTTTLTLPDIQGDKTSTPGTPTGVPGEGDGSIANGTYYYVVASVDETGETVHGPESAAVTVTGSEDTVTITWTAVEGADSYKVFRSTASGTYNTPALVGSPSTNTYEDTAATPSSGAPVGASTVDYNHVQEVDLKAVVPTDATSGAVEYKTRILYQYTE